MSGYQIEDNEMVECLDVLRGKKPRHSIWRYHCTPTNAKNVGSSPNWYAMAAGIACAMKDLDAIRWLLAVLREPNDTGQQEALTDDSHFLMRMIGWYVARVGLRRNPGVPGASELLVLLDEHIRQAWAMMMFCATDPFDPAKTYIVNAGQRAADPKTSKSLIEYFWLRGHGYSHDQIANLSSVLLGRSMANQANRVYKNQEDVTHHEIADLLWGDLKTDIGLIATTLRRDGWPGVWGFVKRGTRGSFHFLRFEGDGYISLLEDDFGTDNPRTVAKSVGKGKLPAQFPGVDQRRHNTDCWATLDLETRQIHAYDSDAGSYVSDFPPGKILFHGFTDREGVSNLTSDVPPPVEPPDPEPGTKPIDPPRQKSWWRRLLDFLQI